MSFAKLDRLIAALESTEKLQTRINKETAKAIEVELRKQYETGTDPDGNPYSPLAPSTLARGRTPPPLTDKGIMKANTKVFSTPKGWRIDVKRPGKNPNVPKFHQDGTAKMPARPIVPPAGKVPARWATVIQQVCLTAIVDHFKIR